MTQEETWFLKLLRTGVNWKCQCKTIHIKIIKITIKENHIFYSKREKGPSGSIYISRATLPKKQRKTSDFKDVGENIFFLSSPSSTCSNSIRDPLLFLSLYTRRREHGKRGRKHSTLWKYSEDIRDIYRYLKDNGTVGGRCTYFEWN